jgi:formylglycine-generating enzyme required for sulfatase activity
MTPPDGRAGASSRRTVVAMVAGLVALAGAGGILWRITQQEPDTSEPAAEAGPLTTEQEASDPAVEAEARQAMSSPVPSPTGAPSEAMRDCPQCPEMVLVPAGEFTMGSPPDEPDRSDVEGPQRKVTIAEPFWIGRYEVTFAEWDAFVAAGGCSTKPGDQRWGRDNRPVINVIWNDAKE